MPKRILLISLLFMGAGFLPVLQGVRLFLTESQEEVFFPALVLLPLGVGIFLGYNPARMLSLGLVFAGFVGTALLLIQGLRHQPGSGLLDLFLYLWGRESWSPSLLRMFLGYLLMFWMLRGLTSPATEVFFGLRAHPPTPRPSWFPRALPPTVGLAGAVFVLMGITGIWMLWQGDSRLGMMSLLQSLCLPVGLGLWFRSPNARRWACMGFAGVYTVGAVLFVKRHEVWMSWWPAFAAMALLHAGLYTRNSTRWFRHPPGVPDGVLWAAFPYLCSLLLAPIGLGLIQGRVASRFWARNVAVLLVLSFILFHGGLGVLMVLASLFQGASAWLTAIMVLALGLVLCTVAAAFAAMLHVALGTEAADRYFGKASSHVPS